MGEILVPNTVVVSTYVERDVDGTEYWSALISRVLGKITVVRGYGSTEDEAVKKCLAELASRI